MNFDQVRDPTGLVHEVNTLVVWRLNVTETVCGDEKFTPTLDETDAPPTCLFCIGAKRP